MTKYDTCRFRFYRTTSLKYKYNKIGFVAKNLASVTAHRSPLRHFSDFSPSFEALRVAKAKK